MYESNRALGMVFAVALAASAHQAQAQSACGAGNQCPAGTLCQQGSCVVFQYGVQPTPAYATPQPGPQYGAPQYGVQPYAGPQYGYPPREPRTVTRLNLGFVITGSVVLGVFWATNLLVSLLAGVDPFGSTRAAAWDAFRLTSIIPVVGPWIELAVKPTRFEQDGWGTWLIADGILQTVGLALLIIGIATPSTQTVYARSDGIQWALLPSAGPTHTGMTLLGRF